MTTEQILGLYNYWVVIFLMMTGFYIVIARGNMVKTVIGLNIFQTSVFLLYITMGKVKGGTAPIIPPEVFAESSHDGHDSHQHTDAHTEGHSAGADLAHESFQESTQGYGAETLQYSGQDGSEIIYSNPLPSVLMLTAIVVGIATTALALALIVRIREDYGSMEEDEVLEMDRKS